MAQLDPAEQAKQVQASPIAQKYAQVLDRESAYEKLLAKSAAPPAAAPAEQGQAPSDARADEPRREKEKDDEEAGLGDKVSAVLGSSAFKAFTRNVGSSLGREITRSLFGTARRRR
jgi:hypothetical protein